LVVVVVKPFVEPPIPVILNAVVRAFKKIEVSALNGCAKNLKCPFA
jgi:hypothetical protein